MTGGNNLSCIEIRYLQTVVLWTYGRETKTTENLDELTQRQIIYMETKNRSKVKERKERCKKEEKSSRGKEKEERKKIRPGTRPTDTAIIGQGQ